MFEATLWRQKLFLQFKNSLTVLYNNADSEEVYTVCDLFIEIELKQVYFNTEQVFSLQMTFYVEIDDKPSFFQY